MSVRARLKPKFHTIQIMAQTSKQDISSKMPVKARSAYFGAMIGDALGTTLEFKTKEEALQTMKAYGYFENCLIGKGPFNVAPGQFTDDTEMALALTSVVADGATYTTDAAANAYYKWFKSKPFDMGITTSNAVSQPDAKQMKAAAKKFNAESLSNGMLMRIYGLVCFYTSKTYEQLIKAVKKDISLTHSHPEAHHIAIIYATILDGAIRGYGYEYLFDWIRKHDQHSPLVQSLMHSLDNDLAFFNYNGQIYILDDIGSKNIGFVGFALWLSLIAMKKYDNYKTAILSTVSHGGDTDTNACIVGAIMGALYPKTIPSKWIDSVLTCQTTRHKTYPLSNPEVWTLFFM
jgi:ADP-ribosylglycohydrolase